MTLELRTHLRRDRRVAFAVLVGMLAMTGAGLLAGAGTSVEAQRIDVADRSLGTFVEILARNGAAAAGLVTGAVTGGLSTLGMSIVVSIYFGVVVRIGHSALGSSASAQLLLPFAPLELLAMVAAAVAGFLPVARAISGACAPDGPGRWTSRAARGYADGLRDALWWVGCSLVLLVVAALLETLVGVPRPTGG